ncbi:peptidase [Microbacterium phage Nicole72]|uniref:Peptidase n=1 Tax=Microbacterium phage Nicole72 TaxID=3062838 RepID=A0ACD4UHL9_9CAUD|nr:peptidase [Microbacterium phage Nicole72]
MRRWRGVVAVEGVVTEDGRLIEPTACTWAEDIEDAPVPLMPVWTGERTGDGFDWSLPMIGWADRFERVEEEGRVRIYASGPLFDDATLPERLDLSVFVTEVTFAGEGVDYPLAVTHGRIRQIGLGGERVWDECVLVEQADA